MIYSEKNN